MGELFNTIYSKKDNKILGYITILLLSLHHVRLKRKHTM